VASHSTAHRSVCQLPVPSILQMTRTPILRTRYDGNRAHRTLVYARLVKDKRRILLSKVGMSHPQSRKKRAVSPDLPTKIYGRKMLPID